MKCICCKSKKVAKRPLGLSNYFLCRSCGFIFQQSPRTDLQTKSIVDHYQNDDPHSAVASSKQGFFEMAINKLSSKVRENRPSILDIGCGYGYFLELAQQYGWKANGVEITTQIASRTQQKFGKDCIFPGQLKHANYPDQSFHAVTLWDVLFIVENPEEELRESLRILKPGGIIGIRVRNVWFQRIAYYGYMPFKKIFQKVGIRHPYVFHPYCYSSRAIELLLGRLGFTNIEITNSPLTSGDPYEHTESALLVKLVKLCIRILSKTIYGLSLKKWIVGPSILVWAEKNR